MRSLDIDDNPLAMCCPQLNTQDVGVSFGRIADTSCFA
jgi:hypothetical protein